MNNKKLIDDLKEKIDMSLEEYLKACKLEDNIERLYRKGVNQGRIMTVSYVALLMEEHGLISNKEYEEISNYEKEAINKLD